MPSWLLDENHIQGEMSDEEFEHQVQERMAKRVQEEFQKGQDYGNDGMVSVYEEKFRRDGIAYKIAVIRYFAVNRENGCFTLQDSCIGMNDIGKWVIVEHEGDIPYDLKNFLSLDEWLYHDTLHSGQENWTLRKQWEYAKEMVEDDFHAVKDIRSTFNKRVEEIRAEMEVWLASQNGV